jgi:hypothetical protein
MIPGVAEDLSSFIFTRVEGEDNMILQNTGNFSLSDTASHPGRHELSASLHDNLKPHVNMNLLLGKGNMIWISRTPTQTKASGLTDKS